MAKKSNCKKKCQAQSDSKDCDGGVCPINKKKNNKLLSLAISSWNSVVDACLSINNKK